jgi:membrane-associated protease RseP (regulator of RpoE activity)
MVISTVGLEPASLLYAIPIMIISGIISFYLFSALLYYAYKNKKSKSFKQAKLLIIILLIIFNPVFIAISDSLNTVYVFALSQESCGVTFQAFLEDSPAMDAGMVTGETIISIDGIEIRNTDEMSDYFDANQYEKTITVKTNEGNEYQFTLRYYETPSKPSRYMMGIAYLSNVFCPR